eukprot:TRINITY_DN2371_c0_g1_i1.p1 TRINITY_DN2371_c0_g1~~TRINITY_DN2371_c0_g1_i1.p1  ORF type:complete len:296 (+),score=134.44 TRINITY_DN2371_c0_g1_i1:117-1004(+)
MAGMTPAADAGTLEKVGFYLHVALRLGIIVFCILSIVGFGLLLDGMGDSDLNFIGQGFSIVSYSMYMLVLFLVLITQFEVEILMKYLMVMYFRPVKAVVLLFMGVQILNTRQLMKEADLDSTFQVVITNMSGYFFVIAGVVYIGFSIANTGTEEFMQTAQEAAAGFSAGADAGRERGQSTGGGFFGKKEKKEKKEAKPETLLGDVQMEDSAPRPPPVTSDGDFPFATDAAPHAQTSDPFSQKGGVETDTYTPPPVVVDQDIQSRRQQEEDELERMYAQASNQQQTTTSSGFAAAD